GRGGAGTTPGLRGTGARLGRERGRVGSDAGPGGAVAVVVDTAAPDLDIQRARRFSRLGGPRADSLRQSVSVAAWACGFGTQAFVFRGARGVPPQGRDTHLNRRSTMSDRSRFVFTSESVSEGHPDKVSDYIADSILDAHFEQDPDAHVACEVLVKDGHVVLAGEITSRAEVDTEAIVRNAIAEIGYTDESQSFCASRVRIQSLLSEQAHEIGASVRRSDDQILEQGAGDQGIMFGYATNETPEYMPLPILLAHRLARTLARYRKQENGVSWLRPDSKTQVSVVYGNGRPVRVTDVLVSTMHAPDVTQDEIRSFVATTLVPEALGDWWHDELRLIVNPSGSFVQGGPSADAGVTGRKIIVDTY